MRRRVPITLLATFLATIAAPAAGAPPDSMPHCNIALEKGAGAHVVRFHTRCDYEQREIGIYSDEKLASADEEVSLSGPVDPGDGFTCAIEGGFVGCEGTAGEGVRLDGRFRTRRKACKTFLALDVTGGPDCEAGEACIAVVYLSHREVRRPKGC